MGTDPEMLDEHSWKPAGGVKQQEGFALLFGLGSRWVVKPIPRKHIEEQA